MFTRLFARWQMRRSTAYLLSRVDDRMLDDIGLTRTDIEAMHLGLGPDLVLPFFGLEGHSLSRSGPDLP